MCFDFWYHMKIRAVISWSPISYGLPELLLGLRSDYEVFLLPTETKINVILLVSRRGELHSPILHLRYSLLKSRKSVLKYSVWFFQIIVKLSFSILTFKQVFLEHYLQHYKHISTGTKCKFITWNFLLTSQKMKPSS